MTAPEPTAGARAVLAAIVERQADEARVPVQVLRDLGFEDLDHHLADLEADRLIDFVSGEGLATIVQPQGAATTPEPEVVSATDAGIALVSDRPT